eukprot:jgi/Tetstr1/430347/TSEL_001972.t1
MTRTIELPLEGAGGEGDSLLLDSTVEDDVFFDATEASFVDEEALETPAGGSGWQALGSEDTDSPGPSQAGSVACGWGSSFTTGHASSGRLGKAYSVRSSARTLRAVSLESSAAPGGSSTQAASQPQKVYGDSGEPLTWAQVTYLWQHDDDFCDAFTEALQGAPFKDFFWETVPVCSRTAGEQPFEFVVLDAHGALDASSGNPRLFLHSIFQGQDSNQVELFYSSSQRVVIVTPCQNGRADDYAHLAAFLRRGPRAQVRELWRRLGQGVEEKLAAGGDDSCASPGMRPKPLWVSSNGLGVPWLHIRLDSAPKYYNHALWRMAPEKLRANGVSPVAEGPSARLGSLPFGPAAAAAGQQLKHRPVSRGAQHTADGLLGTDEPAAPSSPLRMLDLGAESPSRPVRRTSLASHASLDDSRSVSSLTDDLYACSEASTSFLQGCFSSCGLGILRRRRVPPWRRKKGRRAPSKDHSGAYAACPQMAARRRDLLALAH